ncbi:MAG: Flp pilus assembly protein CpaB [Candidatus Dormibacteraeota bacterium]|nr:Flp pilus assembly protein CpaB [Candidatus Dormibacteraeota bacterium]
MAVDVKPRSNRLLMVIGIIVAVVAFVLVVILGSRGAGGPSGNRDTDVVVAAVDIPAGTQVSDQLIKIEKFAADQVPAGAQTKTKDASGQYAAVALPKGTVLSSANLVNSQSKLPTQKKPYLDIPSGQVAVSIPYGAELQAVSGYIQEGDKIDILYNPTGGDNQKPVWKLTYQNLVVQKVGPPVGAATSGSQQQAASAPTATSIVVFVPAGDAEDLSFIFGSGNYKLVLKSQKDIEKNDQFSTGGASQNSVNSKYGVPKG